MTGCAGAPHAGMIEADLRPTLRKVTVAAIVDGLNVIGRFPLGYDAIMACVALAGRSFENAITVTAFAIDKPVCAVKGKAGFEMIFNFQGRWRGVRNCQTLQ